jgi:hypothetical protein
LSSSHRPTIIKNYFPEAWEVYEKLCLIDGQNDYFSRLTTHGEFAQVPNVKVWVLQDWIDIKVNQKSLKKVQTELGTLETRIISLQQELQEEKIKNEQLQNQIVEQSYLISLMKESRFWKLRDLWFNIKRLLIPF